MHEVAFRLSDVAGKSYAFEELVLAQIRNMRTDPSRAAGLARRRLHRRHRRRGRPDPVRLGGAGFPPWLRARRVRRAARQFDGIQRPRGRCGLGRKRDAMTKNVFAGTWEIAAENGMNKSIARFPDVCMSPPSPPAGPDPDPLSGHVVLEQPQIRLEHGQDRRQGRRAGAEVLLQGTCAGRRGRHTRLRLPMSSRTRSPARPISRPGAWM